MFEVDHHNTAVLAMSTGCIEAPCGDFSYALQERVHCDPTVISMNPQIGFVGLNSRVLAMTMRGEGFASRARPWSAEASPAFKMWPLPFRLGGLCERKRN